MAKSRAKAGTKRTSADVDFAGIPASEEPATARRSSSRKRFTENSPVVLENGIDSEVSASDNADSGSRSSSRKRAKKGEVVATPEVEIDSEKLILDDEDATVPSSVKKSRKKSSPGDDDGESESKLAGKPVKDDEARNRWPKRYQPKSKVKNGVALISENGSSEVEVLQAKCHYTKAVVDGVTFNLDDDCHVKAGDGEPDFIAKIVELFEGVDGEPYFTAQWFYRAEDTVVKQHGSLIDKRRVFFSDIRDDNPLDCIVSKLNIAKVAQNVDMVEKEKSIPPCDFYCDTKYSLHYITFSNILDDNGRTDSDPSSTISSEADVDSGACVNTSNTGESTLANSDVKSGMTLLDLYSGCGAMSTGLCLGASVSGVKLVTKWAVDINPFACESLKLNHPETEVRNEAAEDFLTLLKEWATLCKEFCSKDSNSNSNNADNEDDDEDEDGDVVSKGEFEVGELLSICYGDPNNVNKRGIYFQVRWKGYGPEEDTWEPIDGLRGCDERLRDFVIRGSQSKILPLPGDVDVICGGPPCQGISGFNRFRNKIDPLADPKNHQLVVFMDIVDYLQPKYVLMENVVDLLKFASGFLGRYALGRLVSMNYQARYGIMAAGSYGVPQCRLRVFLWGAHPTKKLPPYPLPTHELVGRGINPTEFEDIVVGSDKSQNLTLEKALYLGDAISDLPSVLNDESRDEMPYGDAPKTEFQKYIRLKKIYLGSSESVEGESLHDTLYDHRPLELNTDDYQRVCRIPKKKGANFRDLPGVLVNSDNRVEWDPAIERVLLPSGKPLVPDYAMTFVHGRSLKPFARLWWDEIINTVVTRAEPHNQAVIHPLQDRVLTIRENARFQGFPDYYKLCGPIKERYMQVGNAVAVSVSLALGYAFGTASQGLCDDKPLITLPFKYPNCLATLCPPQHSESGDQIES